MDELFALRLAQKVGDETAAEHYLKLLSEHSQEKLLSAYLRALKPGAPPTLARQFHSELRHGNGRLAASDDIRLISVKVERRSIAAVVFIGTHLDFTQVRHLSSIAARAESSAIGFLNWIISEFEIESAALECIRGQSGIRREVLSQKVLASCIQARGIPVWQLSKSDLLKAFGHPSLHSRKQLREVVLSMWPVLEDEAADNQQILDAVALGALVQTERLFLN
jgi:hypothetical protein